MEPEYYEENFDASEHELKVKLPCLECLYNPGKNNDTVTYSRRVQYKGHAFCGIFQKLPPCSELEQASIDVDRKRLKAQQLVVTKRVFGQILSAQSACLGEMERVEDIRDRLSGCIEVRAFLIQSQSSKNRVTQQTCRLAGLSRWT